MSDNIKLDNIITSWKELVGDSYSNKNGTFKFIPINRDRRMEMLADLIQTLIDSENYNKDSFNDRVIVKIVSACVNPNSKKIRTWESIVKDEVIVLLNRFWPENISSASPDMLKTKENKLDLKPTNEIESSSTEENQKSNFDEQLKYAKPFNMGPYKDIPSKKVILDEEFAKLLGVKEDD